MTYEERADTRRDVLESELQIAVYAGRIEVAERFSDTKAEELVELLREYGIDCDRLFKAPCG